MAYTVHSRQDRLRMLEAMGISSPAQLFAHIPESLRTSAELRLAPGVSEQDLRTHTDALAAADRVPGPTSFLGAGCYRHFVPAAVQALVSRSEFATAYTPYQAEVSQGTLEHIFEFQTCVCELTGMDVSNASLYDGASAVAEAAFMALRTTGRQQVAVSAGVHPETREVVATYASGPGVDLFPIALHPHRGTTILPDPKRDGSLSEVSAVIAQQPNYLGVVEDLQALAQAAHARGALLVVSVNPATLGVLESPGMLGADIVVGDAQVFGCPPSFGGPSVGFLACRKEHLRQIPGRLVSRTIDADGRPCYALTLQAREQHIRRARATSNICSNQALSALAATIHLALLGPAGLRDRADICLQRAHHLQQRLCRLPGVRLLVDGPFFNEFVLRLPCSADLFRAAMRERGVDPGVPMRRLAPGPTAGDEAALPVDESLLVAVTELNPPHALDLYVEAASLVLAALDPELSPAPAETAEGRVSSLEPKP